MTISIHFNGLYETPLGDFHADSSKGEYYKFYRDFWQRGHWLKVTEYCFLDAISSCPQFYQQVIFQESLSACATVPGVNSSA